MYRFDDILKFYCTDYITVLNLWGCTAIEGLLDMS